RLRPRLAALALERGQQRRLLTGDVGAGPAVQHDGRVVARAEHVAADVALLARLLERRAQHLELGAVLPADVDERRRGTDAVAHRQDALDQRVRVAEHDLAVLEGARLRLVGVDAQVGRLAVLGQERRLAAGREAGTAAAAQAGAVDGGDHVAWLAGQRLSQLLVAAVPLVLGDVAPVTFEVEQDADVAHAPASASARSEATSSGTCSAGNGSW